MLSYLEPADVEAVGASCRACVDASRSDVVWRRLHVGPLTAGGPRASFIAATAAARQLRMANRAQEARRTATHAFRVWLAPLAPALSFAPSFICIAAFCLMLAGIAPPPPLAPLPWVAVFSPWLAGTLHAAAATTVPLLVWQHILSWHWSRSGRWRVGTPRWPAAVSRLPPLEARESTGRFRGLMWYTWPASWSLTTRLPLTAAALIAVLLLWSASQITLCVLTLTGTVPLQATSWAMVFTPTFIAAGVLGVVVGRLFLGWAAVKAQRRHVGAGPAVPDFSDVCPAIGLGMTTTAAVILPLVPLVLTLDNDDESWMAYLHDFATAVALLNAVGALVFGCVASQRMAERRVRQLRGFREPLLMRADIPRRAGAVLLLGGGGGGGGDGGGAGPLFVGMERRPRFVGRGRLQGDGDGDGGEPRPPSWPDDDPPALYRFSLCFFLLCGSCVWQPVLYYITGAFPFGYSLVQGAAISCCASLRCLYMARARARLTRQVFPGPVTLATACCVLASACTCTCCRVLPCCGGARRSAFDEAMAALGAASAVGARLTPEQQADDALVEPPPPVIADEVAVPADDDEADEEGDAVAIVAAAAAGAIIILRREGARARMPDDV